MFDRLYIAAGDRPPPLARKGSPLETMTLLDKLLAGKTDTVHLTTRCSRTFEATPHGEGASKEWTVKALTPCCLQEAKVSKVYGQVVCSNCLEEVGDYYLLEALVSADHIDGDFIKILEAHITDEHCPIPFECVNHTIWQFEDRLELGAF